MSVSPEARVLYHPLPPGAEAVAGVDAWTAALDDCDPDRADTAIAAAGDGAAKAALRVVAELARARWSMPGASLPRALAGANDALEREDGPLSRYAAGLAAAWAVRTQEAEGHLAKVVDACGQPFAAELLAQIRIDGDDLDGAIAALDAVPPQLRRLRGLAWTRARAEAARGQGAKAGVIASDILTGSETASDETNLDIVLHELDPDRRLPFLENLSAKTGSALVRGRLCWARALAASPLFAAVDRIGARKWARAGVAVLVPGRAPPPALVVFLLLGLLPIGILRILLLPLPLHGFLVAHARAVAQTGQNPVLRLPRGGWGAVALWGFLLGSIAAALFHATPWLVLSGVSLVALAIVLVRIESRMPTTE